MSIGKPSFLQLVKPLQNNENSTGNCRVASYFSMSRNEANIPENQTKPNVRLFGSEMR